MFGYVKICKPELKVKDFESYKAVYCSLCKQLSKEYSFLSSFLLNYDLTFYAVFAMANGEQCPSFSKGRCRFNPLKSCGYCKTQSDILSRAAALLVLMCYFKVIDNIRDSSFFGKVAFTLLRPLAALWKNKAKKKYPQYYIECEKMYNSQIATEKSDAGVDQAAEPTAKLLEFMFAELAYDEKIRPAYEQFGYHLGKWIYVLDAACDIDDDIKNKSFNPIYNKLKLSKEESADYANGILNNSVYLLTSAYRLIDKRRFEDILDNIVLIGLTKTQKSLLKSGKGQVNE